MKQKSDAFHRILNIILAIFYLPFSFVCILFYMATEVVFRENNQLVILVYNVVAHVGIFMPVFAYAMLYLSHRLYNAGRNNASYVVRFLPIIVMLIAIVLAVVVESLVN